MKHWPQIQLASRFAPCGFALAVNHLSSQNERVEQLMDTFWRDFRYALRRLGKSPGFTLVAILSLGLGIGANTAIFSLLDALTLRPLPVKEPQRLVRIGQVDSHASIAPVPSPIYDELRKDPLIEGVCGVSTPLTTVELNDSALPLSGHALSGDCYEMLGVRPAIGRLFTREDDIPNGPRVAVLSYRFWHGHLGGDPNVVGQSIRIEGVPFRVIGVTEPRFQGLLLGFPPNVSFPITQEVRLIPARSTMEQNFYWSWAFARVKPGVTRERVRAQLSVDWRRMLDEALPARVQGAQRSEMLDAPLAVGSGATGIDYMLRNRFQEPLSALLAISALVLLVSCLNVANLLLARGLRRRREIAIRQALGAKRSQIVCGLLAESAALVVGGVGCALLLTHSVDRFLLALLSRMYSGFAVTTSPDARMLLFTSGATLIALLFFAVLPAKEMSAVVPGEALKSGSLSSLVQSRVRRILICGQVALTLVLVMGASLFVETLRHLREESLGFEVRGLLNVELMPLPGGYTNGFNGPTYYRDLLVRMRNLPGVETVSMSHFSPLFTTGFNEEIRAVEAPKAPGIETPAVWVSDGFLAAMRIPILQGEDFHRSDVPESQKTAIVSGSLAKRLFPGGEVLGKHIRVGSEKKTEDLEIVGVAAGAKLMDPRATDLGFVYLNYWQYPEYEKWSDIELRYSGDSASLLSAVRQALQEAGHEYPLRMQTLIEQRDSSLLRESLLAALGTAYGILALTLAGVGLLGLLSFLVANRTAEIGIRVALGAERRHVRWLVVRESATLVGAGLLVGLPLSYATARALSGLLYGVGALPIVPLLFSITLLLVIAGVATLIPVRRATAVDPIAALKYE